MTLHFHAFLPLTINIIVSSSRRLWALAPLYPNPDLRRSWFRHCLNKVPWPAGHAHPSEIRVKASQQAGWYKPRTYFWGGTLNCHVIYPIYMHASFTNTIPYPLYYYLPSNRINAISIHVSQLERQEFWAILVYISDHFFKSPIRKHRDNASIPALKHLIYQLGATIV